MALFLKLDLPAGFSTQVTPISSALSCIPYDKLNRGATLYMCREASTLKINELRDGMRRVDVEGRVQQISEPRTVNIRTGGQAKVADCILQDDSGSIKLSLWDEQIDMVTTGAHIRIENGYTNSFRGEVRLNVGRYGRLQALE